VAVPDYTSYMQFWTHNLLKKKGNMFYMLLQGEKAEFLIAQIALIAC
jgi:hypothetical protein